MFQDFSFYCRYSVNGQEFVTVKKSTQHFLLKEKIINNRLTIKLEPLVSEITFASCSIKIVYDFKYNDRIYCNGYQSWSTSREYQKEDRDIGLKAIAKLPIVKPLCTIFGDYGFYNYPRTSGIFHSYTYTYIRNNDNLLLIGSMSDKTAFTVFECDMKQNTISVNKDVDGMLISKTIVLMDLAFYNGEYEDVFDKYFADMSIPKPKANLLIGYTSWYNYFQKISEDIILRDLDGLSKVGKEANIFQIDDGYQSAVGDWLDVNNVKFPRGMKFIADEIHNRGYKAGIWLAPFSCQRSSKIAKEHPDWLIKNSYGKPELGCIGWGGAYTLDIYIPEVREYLKNVFNEVLRVWGYDMVKLDFLYSQCIKPRAGKTRAQIMSDALLFLRECVGDDKLILGCGVPLGVSFGVVDCCRIGPDVDLSYSEKIYSKITNNEVISTRDAITNAVFRRHLNGRAFLNDPDVFFLRKDNLKFSIEQKLLLAKVNNLFGNVLFVSDNVGNYDDEQLHYLIETFNKKNVKIVNASFINYDNIEVIYSVDNALNKLTINLKA